MQLNREKKEKLSANKFKCFTDKISWTIFAAPVLLLFFCLFLFFLNNRELLTYNKDYNSVLSFSHST